MIIPFPSSCCLADKTRERSLYIWRTANRTESKLQLATFQNIQKTSTAVPTTDVY
jgi:hypothetical protein